MPATRSAKRPEPNGSKRLYRFAFSLWGMVGGVALVAPWPYTLSAVLFATFLTFAALDGDAS